jgi:hypothetical protein
MEKRLKLMKKVRFRKKEIKEGRRISIREAFQRKGRDHPVISNYEISL